MQVRNVAAGLGAGPALRRFEITYLDLQTTSGAGAKTFNLFQNPTDTVSFPANSMLLGVRKKHSVAFTGGSLSAMTVSVGKSGSATFFTSAFDVFQAVAATTVQETALFKMGQVTALAIIATFTPTGDTCLNCTAGAMIIDIFALPVSTPLS